MNEHTSAVLAGLLLLSAALPAAVGGAAGSGDGLALLTFNPQVIEVEPGENVTVAIVLQSSPQVASGAYKAGVIVDFDPTYVAVRDVERGPFMERMRNTTVRTNISQIDNQQGLFAYELVRDPPRGGVTGYSPFAFATFHVREGAPEGNFTMRYRAARILLTDGNFQQVTLREAEFRINRTAPVDSSPANGSDAAATTSQSNAGGDGQQATTQASQGGNQGGGNQGSSGDGGLPMQALVGVGALVGTLGLFGGMLVLMRKL